MRTILKVASFGVSAAVLYTAGAYFQITGGRVKTCGWDEFWWCDSKKCDLQVNVTSCAADGSGISVDKSPLHMCNPKKVVWTIPNPDKRQYKFSPYGIEFKTADPDFDSKMPNDHKFVWRNKHTHPADDTEPAVEWEYKINILKINGDACASLDPRIYNE